MPIICTSFATASSGEDVRRIAPPAEFRESDPNCVDIALINNMPDAALQTTERQFMSLLDLASGKAVVRLTFYALSEVPRAEAARARLASVYAEVGDLWEREFDGLIVTGAEPVAPKLEDEAYWGSLTRIMDWAERHTLSAVWSCLAAHAAVLHLDGIGRLRLSDKRFGVFDASRVSDHLLTEGAPSSLRVPHSRWNDLSGDALTACGYQVLTTSAEAGVDAFVKQRKSLFLFFQGHPEYEAETLLREYRRDISRFVRGERDIYPSMPRGYFDQETTGALAALQERAQLERREDLMADFPVALASSRVVNTWRPAAACTYRNWLQYVCEQKKQRVRNRARTVRV